MASPLRNNRPIDPAAFSMNLYARSTPLLVYQRLSLLPALLWAGLIFYMSSMSEPPQPKFWLPPHADKIVHAGLYAILAGLLYPPLRLRGIRATRAAIIALILASLYGITDELHQSRIDNRHADIWDWAADTIGATSVFLVARWEAQWWPRRIVGDPP